jgi:hypothetical protein
LEQGASHTEIVCSGKSQITMFVLWSAKDCLETEERLLDNRMLLVLLCYCNEIVCSGKLQIIQFLMWPAGDFLEIEESLNVAYDF